MSIPREFREPPSSAHSPIVPLVWEPRRILIVGLVCWVTAYGLSQLTVAQTGIPAMFLPAGIAVGLLLRLPYRMWWWVVAGIAAVDVVFGPMLGVAPFVVCLIWGTANITTSVSLAALLRWARVDMTHARDPIVLGLISGVVLAVVAVVGSLALAFVSDVEPTQFWADWWGADVLSIVLVVPLVLLTGRASPPSGRRAVEAIGWLAVTAFAVGATFSDAVDLVLPIWVWLIVSTPLVVLYGVRFGILAMSAFLLVLDLIAVAYTAAGMGPFQPLAIDSGTPLRSLQLVLIVLAVSVQSVSILIAKLLRHGQTLAGQQALLDAVLESSPIPTALLSGDGGHVLRANFALRELLGHDCPDFVEFFPASERSGVTDLLQAAERADGTVSVGEFAALDRNGEPLWVRLRVTGVAADDFDRYGAVHLGANFARVVHVEDMTEVRVREQRLQHDASTDPLTGLANRRHMITTIDQALETTAPGHLLAVTYLDLDGFKAVNDTQGHDVGDLVLQEVAARLRDCVLDDELLARAGGDEFVLVTRDVPDAEVAAIRAQQLRDRLQSAAVLGCDIGASIGVIVTGNPLVGHAELLKRADALMYEAKGLGGNTVCSAGP